MEGIQSIVPTEISLPTHGESVSHRGCVYILGDQIGEGHFGKVYACSDRWANDLVAKILLPKGRSYDDVRVHWQRELANLLTLRHPNITYAYDAFEYRGTFYLIVERCGSDLSDLIKLEGLHAELWLPALARDVLQGLEFMHRAGYVHKDLHPGNIFVSWTRDRMIKNREPVVSFKIGDLGISRLESDLDIFNTMLAQWMLPPEAIDPREYGPVGKTIDIYHTGLVLLSLLLGHIPSFSREEILGGRPREMAEALRSPYSAAIAHALRRHAASRPSSAADFWEEIVRVMPTEHQPI